MRKRSIFGWKNRRTNIKVLLYGGPSTPNKKNVTIKKKQPFKENVFNTLIT